MKRSRSGRIASPDKVQPRSKSPRLQRGGFLENNEKANVEQQTKMDDMREAMQDLLAPGSRQIQ